jgi:hypothetical protein
MAIGNFGANVSNTAGLNTTSDRSEGAQFAPQPASKPMTETELLAFLQMCETACAVYGRSEVSLAQSDALDRYYGRDYGTEREGRSQAHTYEVRQQVNWALPALMRIFDGSDDLVSIKSSDTVTVTEDQATAMADGLNHIFFNDNEGYKRLYDFIFDGLLQRIGVILVRPKFPELQPPETFEGLTQPEIQALLQAGYRILSQTPSNSPTNPQNVANTVDIVAQKSSPFRIEIETVPPEEFRWEATARSIRKEHDCRYHSRIKRCFLKDLQREFPEKALDLERTSSGNLQIGDAQARWLARHQDGASSDRALDSDSFYSRRELLIHEFARVDYDGDGIIELREVLRVNQVILYNEPTDDTLFHIWSPARIPHTVVGLSLADDAIETQGINTSLTRRGLDSLALSLNQRVAFDATSTDQETIDALLDNKIGGIIGTLGNPANALMPIVVPDVSQQAMEWKQHFTTALEQSTGIGPNFNGLDPNALAPMQSGIAANIQQTAQSARLELIARAAADGLQEIFKTILRLVVRYQDQVRQIQRSNQPPLVIDPDQWREDAQITVHAGISAASRANQLANLIQIASAQEKIMMTLGPNNLITNLSQYSNTLYAIVNAMGMRNPERFYNQVSLQQVQQMQAQQAQQPQQQSPQQQKVQADAQAQMQKQQTDRMAMQATQTRLDEEQQATIARQERQMVAELQLKKQQIMDELELRRAAMIGELELQREVQLAKVRMGANGTGSSPAGLSPVRNAGVSTGQMPSVDFGGKPG